MATKIDYTKHGIYDRYTGRPFPDVAVTVNDIEHAHILEKAAIEEADDEKLAEIVNFVIDNRAKFSIIYAQYVLDFASGAIK